MADNEQTLENANHEFGTKPIMKLIIKYGGLTLIGMLAQVVMVIFEGIIIGNGCGADGLACVGLVMPLENLQLAIGTGFGIGLSTLAAVEMGKGNKEKARDIFGTGSFFISLVMLILGLILIAFADPIARLLGTPDEYMQYMVPFIRIFGVGYPFCGYAGTAVAFFRLDERPSLATAAMTVTAILGVVWLYINCFVINYGIVGTGWYYAFSVGGWSFFGIYFFYSKKTNFRYHKRDLHIDWKVNGQAVRIGLPYFCIQVSVSVFGIIINNIISRVGTDLDLSVYAIINGYIIYILTMLTTSITTGTQPIISYNLGERMLGRVRCMMKNTVIINTIVVGVVTALFVVLARPLCYVFCGPGELLEACAPVTRIAICCTFLGSAISVMSAYYQSVEKVTLSVILGIARYIIFCTPVMLILALAAGMGIEGVWIALPVADVLAFALAIITMLRENKRLVLMETVKQ